MAYENLAEAGLDYFPCRYGKSRLVFRGPKRRMSGAYAVVIGGTETYGKFVPRPYADVLEDCIGMPVVNFGAVNAGIDVFLSDDAVRDAARGARAVVVQVMGAHNLSNRFYTVHPRRNDRFLKASTLLRSIYPDVDFTEFNFTRHLVQSLCDRDSERFAAVRREVQTAWTARMKTFIQSLESPVVLLWMSDRAPGDPVDIQSPTDPLFVDQAMMDALRPLVSGVVDARPSETALSEGLQGMVFAELEMPAAAEVPNPAVHVETAQKLAQGLRHLI